MVLLVLEQQIKVLAVEQPQVHLVEIHLVVVVELVLLVVMPHLAQVLVMVVLVFRAT
jgi:hypothetical protein